MTQSSRIGRGELPLNQIIHGDCLEVMKTFPDKSIDLVLTDPPYGMSYQSSRRTEKYDMILGDTDLSWFPKFAKEAYRLLKDDSHIYVFCNDYAVSDFRRELEFAGFQNKRTLVWVKNNHTSGDLEGDYGNKTEFCLFVHKGRKELNGKRDTNVLQFDRVATELHPTQKPVDLMEFLIIKSSSEGEVVLDPFAGSGTTGVACKMLKRNYICIEKEEKYVNICHERLQATTSPMF